jgi:predicted transcriptional regulator
MLASKNTKILVSMPQKLSDEVTEFAKELNQNKSALINQALEFYFDHLDLQIAKKRSLEKNETSNINSNSKKEETTKTTESLTFVKLINVAKIKGDLNKKYFDKVIEVNANVLLCRDDENIIELYYGPFLEDEIRDNLLSKLIKNGFKEAYSLEMTKEEFDKRCNY